MKTYSNPITRLEALLSEEHLLVGSLYLNISDTPGDPLNAN